MTIENRIKSLETKHRELDILIEKMYNEGYSDDEIAKLKRKKLQLKDEISSAKQKLESNNG